MYRFVQRTPAEELYSAKITGQMVMDIENRQRIAVACEFGIGGYEVTSHVRVVWNEFGREIEFEKRIYSAQEYALMKTLLAEDA